MKRRKFAVRAPVFIILFICTLIFYKPDEVKAFDNGCDIPSTDTIANRYHDRPSTSGYDTWASWISWYTSMGYTYNGCQECKIAYSSGWYTGWWISLTDSAGNLRYAILREVNGSYHGFYNHWIKIDEGNGKRVYYYTNERSIIYQNTWMHVRVNNDNYQPTDRHGYFVFNSSGRMCLGWHKSSNGRWYYMKMDYTNNDDGPCIKVGEKDGFCWKTEKSSTAYSEGLYYFDGIDVITNAYVMDTSGKYKNDKGEYINAFNSSVHYAVGDGDKKVRPLKNNTLEPDADFLDDYDTGFTVNTSMAGSVTGTLNLNIQNGDYNSYKVGQFYYFFDRNLYKMTMNHYKYNIGTGSWDKKAFATTTANAYYATKFTPSYTTTPTGFYNYQRDYDKGWTVVSDGTFNLYYYPNTYTQTINFYTYGASGTYNNPTYKTTYLNKKTYSSYYGSTFNAKSHGADYGNVAGYHWWKVDSDSWTVTGDASTNSFYYPNKYRISVDVAGGTGSNGNYDMEYGTTINLGTPSRTGWQFTGWKIIYDNSINTTLSGNTLTIGYNKTYPYQDYMTEASVKIIANWKDITAPVSSDTILTATNPTKTITYATVTATGKTAETPWVNNDVK